MKFTTIDNNAMVFFGFPEFLSALALIIIAWTFAGTKYNFRIKTAPIPLRKVSFISISLVGILTLLTEFWRSEGFPIPLGPIPQSLWQVFLGGVFLINFLIWVWFSFMEPPKFSIFNSKRYVNTVYEYFVKGDFSDLSIIADELNRSVEKIIYFSYEVSNGDDSDIKKLSKTSRIANELILLLGDKRFCKAVAISSSRTAIKIFTEIKKSKKYKIPIQSFASNFVNESILEKDSFLYHENSGYESGLIGHLKPVTMSVFSDYIMVESIGSLLDPNPDHYSTWKADEWKAYYRLVVITFEDYLNHSIAEHSYVLFRSMHYIEGSLLKLARLNGSKDYYIESDIFKTFNITIDFLGQILQKINNHDLSEKIKLKPEAHEETIFDHLGKLICEVIYYGSQIREPITLCWMIQHNMIWSKLIDNNLLQDKPSVILRYKIRRQIYEELKEIEVFPNYKNISLLIYLLNIFGLKESRNLIFSKDMEPLQNIVISLCKKYLWKVYNKKPHVVNDCLIEGMYIDENEKALVKINLMDRLNPKPKKTILKLDEIEI